MSYRIEVAPAAERHLRRLDPALRTRIAARLRQLAENPRPHGTRQLSAPERLWRLRVGASRVVYQIQDDRLVVLVLRVGYRREIYRELDRLRGR